MINLLTPFVIQRSFATKDLVYIYVYTHYCVTEIFRTESSTTRLRFALNDTVEKVDVPEILRFALDDNLMLTDISSLPYILRVALDDNRD